MIYTHSGNLGDILYSLPCINHLEQGKKEAILYVKATNYEDGNGNVYEQLREFLCQQNCIKEVQPFVPQNPDNWNWSWDKVNRRHLPERWEGIRFDYDLDLARGQARSGRVYIVKRYYDTFGIDKPVEIPFLKVDDLYKRDEKYALFAVSGRWNSYFYDWGKLYEQARQKYEHIYFIGFISEWLEFQTRYAQIEQLLAKDTLELARIIRDSDHLYCCQGPSVVLAQGLNKNYSLLPNHPPGSFMRTNCILGTENETILKQDYSMIK